MENESNADQPSATNHPLFGCMKGLITIAPGVDLTDPAFPDWEAHEEGHYGPDSELGQIWAQAVGKLLEK